MRQGLRRARCIYTPWCDEHGKVIDDGTVTRLGGKHVPLDRAPTRACAGSPQNAAGLDVAIEDVSERVAALALQGPTSAACCAPVAEADIASLKYFRVTTGTIAGDSGRHLAHRLHRRSRLRDLDAVGVARSAVWDALDGGGPRVRHPSRRDAGARRGARSRRGCCSDRRRLQQQQEGADRSPEALPSRNGPLAPRPASGEGAFSSARRRSSRRRVGGPRKEIAGLEADWTEVESLFERAGLPPRHPGGGFPAWRFLVYRQGQPDRPGDLDDMVTDLKKTIALATVDAAHASPGNRLSLEVTVERRPPPGDSAHVVKTPFFNPRRKTATPPW